MPVRIRKVGHGRVSVRTPGGLKSKATTPEKAKKQEKLLNAIEHDPTFKPKKKKRSKSK